MLVADIGCTAASDANSAAVADAGLAAASDAALLMSQAISEPDSLDGAMLDSSGRTPVVSATLSASLLVESRDNQLDEVSSQPLLSSPTPSNFNWGKC